MHLCDCRQELVVEVGDDPRRTSFAEADLHTVRERPQGPEHSQENYRLPHVRQVACGGVGDQLGEGSRQHYRDHERASRHHQLTQHRQEQVPAGGCAATPQPGIDRSAARPRHRTGSPTGSGICSAEMR
ncbi:Uncharacterised protein [Mycobacteroides abscessus subsp. abscessus]|nr:Uncharacterised protein [Mycobacteroides abscessus subsp. abscessus]